MTDDLKARARAQISPKGLRDPNEDLMEELVEALDAKDAEIHDALQAANAQRSRAQAAERERDAAIQNCKEFNKAGLRFVRELEALRQKYEGLNNVASTLNDDADKLQRERDEARAEVERLRSVLCRFREHVFHGATQWKMEYGTLQHPIWSEIAQALPEDCATPNGCEHAQHQPAPTKAGGRDSVGNADTHESDYERGLEDAAKVVEQHVCWHERAEEKHWAEVESEARRDLAAAIRAKAQEGRDDG